MPSTSLTDNSRFAAHTAIRTIHLIDIENLLGDPAFTAVEAAQVQAEYVRTTGCKPTDHVVVASSHFAAPAAWFGWQCDRRLVRSGADGADLALLDVLETEHVASRFGNVVVGSGDGIFTEPCARLQGEGCKVTVVSRGPGSLSRELAFAVRDVRFLEDDDVQAAAALRVAA